MAINVAMPPEVGQEDGKPVLFLAGPVQGAPEWQAEAIDMIDAMTDDLTVANPRGEYKPGEFDYESQVDWETEYLSRAARLGAAVFWLARQENQGDADENGFYRAYGQTSRFELGEYKMKHQLLGANLVVGIEPGFGNERYIRRRLSQDCPDVPILNNLADTCLRTVEVVTEAPVRE